VEKLSPRDWSLIARCLDEEGSDADLKELRQLIKLHPGLQDWMRTNEIYIRTSAPDFDSESAFDKLHNRFRNENLI
jgi:hypothetical protein